MRHCLRCLILLALTLATSASYAIGARGSLVIGQTINGGYLGTAYAIGVSGEGDRGIGWLGAGLGAATGLYSSLALTESANLREQDSVFINSTSFWSATEGYLLAWLFTADMRKKLLVSGLLGGAMTGVAAHTTNKYDTSSSDIVMINAAGFWGTVMVVELAAAISPRPSGRAKYVVFTGVTGSLIGGYFMAKNNEERPARTIQVSMYGLLGTFSGAGFAWVMYFRSKRAYFVSMLAGTALGLYVGTKLTKGDDRTNRTPFSKQLSTSQAQHTQFRLGSYTW